jgi:hypothetical protein
MYECVMELQEKVRLAREEISQVTRTSRSPRSRTPAPMAAPTDDDWADLLDDGTGVHKRTGQSSIPVRPPSMPSLSAPLSTPPSGPPVGTATNPPNSRTRTAKLGSEAPTPVPALLRSRRTR